jgi:serine/threonine-protein kinase
VFCTAGELDRAAECLGRAADSILIDITWIELCAVLKPLYDRPDFAEVRAKVRQRADDVWSK